MLYYCCWLLVIALFFPVFSHLYMVRWELLDYSHAYFILPIAVLMVWLKRQAVATLALSQTSFSLGANGAYLPLIIFSLLLFVFGWRHDYIFISTSSIIPLLCGLIGYFHGTRVLKLLAFPIAYLLFLIPPPVGILDAITLPMRHFASAGAEFVLACFHYPIERQGLILYLDHHEIFMAPACSGFRSLITFLALGVVYVYFSKTTLKTKIIFAIAILPLAILGNLVRVIMLCLITYYLGEEMGQGFLHELSGLLVFVVMILGFLLIDGIANATREDE